MPGFVRTKGDEKKWSEAKRASGEQTAKESKGYWKLANYIFHRMKKHQSIEKFEKLQKDLMGLMRSDATKVPNPMKTGEQSVASKTPKAVKMPSASAKPSVFFKAEDYKGLKHASACKLRDFLAEKKSKK
jgi:hypothetical protein